jgi:hypothetical protein
MNRGPVVRLEGVAQQFGGWIKDWWAKKEGKTAPSKKDSEAQRQNRGKSACNDENYRSKGQIYPLA